MIQVRLIDSKSTGSSDRRQRFDVARAMAVDFPEVTRQNTRLFSFVCLEVRVVRVRDVLS